LDEARALMEPTMALLTLLAALLLALPRPPLGRGR